MRTRFLTIFFLLLFMPCVALSGTIDGYDGMDLHYIEFKAMSEPSASSSSSGLIYMDELDNSLYVSLNEGAYEKILTEEVDPSFTTWLSEPPNISIFTNDAGYITSQTDDQTASEVPYTNTTSGLTATEVQSAIDEVEARVDTNDGKVSFNWDYDYGDLINTPTIPSGNQIIDWTQASQGTIHATNYVDNDTTYTASDFKLDDLATPDDNTDLNATATRHGLLPKLENSGTKYLRDDGTWQTPSAGSVEGTAVLSTGETGGNKYLREDGDGTSSWQTVPSGGTSGSNNEMLTDDGAGGIVSESNLTYDGTTLTNIGGTINVLNSAVGIYGEEQTNTELCLKDDNNTGGVTLSEIVTEADIDTFAELDAIVADESLGIGLGQIKGLVVGYSDSNTVTISAGYANCNGTMYFQDSATTYDITSGAANQFVYIFIDDSASTKDSITYRDEDSGVETPAWSDAKQGWYSDQTTTDRVVGVVYCEGSVTMAFFDTADSSNLIKSVLDSRLTSASDMNPTGNWMAPDDAEVSTLCPVNAKEVLLQVESTDSGDATIFSSTYELATEESNVALSPVWRTAGYNTAVMVDWHILGPSRNLRYTADDNDDNNLSVYVHGWAYTR